MKLSIAEFKRRHFRGSTSPAPSPTRSRTVESARRRLLGLPTLGPDFIRRAFAFLEHRGPLPRLAKGKGRTTRTLKESCQCGGADVDQGEPVLRHVQVLGFDSKNRRRYLPEAARDALALYAGVVVNIDHPDNPNASRSVKDRFGRLQNPVLEADGIYADLRFNPMHPLAEMVKWAAANDPASMGLSHNAVGQGQTTNGVFVVEKIVSVRSVDLVADPATTAGLFR